MTDLATIPDLLGTSPADLIDAVVDRPVATLNDARERAERVRAGLDSYTRMRQDIADAYACRDWLALGYPTWFAYLDGEYGPELRRLSRDERPAAVRDLRTQGMSTRAIADVVGASEATVRRDLSTASNDAVGLPDTVVGLDGKERPATRPAPEDRPPRAGEADARLATAEVPVSEAPTAPTVEAGASSPTPAASAPVAELPRTPEGSGPKTSGAGLPPGGDRPASGTKSADDPEQAEAEHRQRSSRSVAESLAHLLLRLDPDPIRWLTDTWQPDAYTLRDLPRVREAFTPAGLRLLARHLTSIADHLDSTGGTL